MKTIDLFAGIGGFSLAGHWLGWETIAFVEKEPYCQKVLAKNFPGVPIHGDIRDYKPKRYAADIICGGFPCQPFSSAGKRKGKEDDRFLWPEMLRVIREAQPTFVVGENVAGILSMDNGAVFEEICLSLEDEGYAVQSFIIPAQAIGAPHRRDRVWIVGYSEHNGRNAAAFKRGTSKAETKSRLCEPERSDTAHRDVQFATNAGYTEPQGRHEAKKGDNRSFAKGQPEKCKPAPSFCNAANPQSIRTQRNWPCWQQKPQSQAGKRVSGCNDSGTWQTNWYEVATRLCRMDDGVPSWVDGHRTARLKALGNAIVPQVAYQVFLSIDEFMSANAA